jgi:hypothetical protein
VHKTCQIYGLSSAMESLKTCQEIPSFRSQPLRYSQSRGSIGSGTKNRKVAGSISDGIIEIVLPAVLWPRFRLNL